MLHILSDYLTACSPLLSIPNLCLLPASWGIPWASKLLRTSPTGAKRLGDSGKRRHPTAFNETCCAPCRPLEPRKMASQKKGHFPLKDWLRPGQATPWCWWTGWPAHTELKKRCFLRSRLVRFFFAGQGGKSKADRGRRGRQGVLKTGYGTLKTGGAGKLHKYTTEWPSTALVVDHGQHLHCHPSALRFCPCLPSALPHCDPHPFPPSALALTLSPVFHSSTRCPNRYDPVLRNEAKRFLSCKTILKNSSVYGILHFD